MVQSPDLAEVIESMYHAFEAYRLKPDTKPCPCCHSSEDDQRLRSKLLRKLGPKDLYGYATDALYTWGDESDFKHFMPRIFELLAQDSRDFVDPQSVFGRLLYVSSGSRSWRTWPIPEQTAICDYSRAVWDAVLASDPDKLSYGAYDWLCSFAQAESDLSNYLDRWLTASSISAHRNLARMIVWEGVPNTTHPGSGYWAQREQQWQQLVDWVRRPEVKDKLASAVEKWNESPFGNELFDAAVLLP